MVIEKYLKNYSELKPITLPKGHWDCALVLPLYAEDETLSHCLESLNASASDTGTCPLVIAVINQNSGSPLEVKRSNTRSEEILRANKLPVFILDRYSQGNEIPEKEGVGLARKIGCDVALCLIHNKQIKSPYIRTTDGDVSVPLNYFETLDGSSASTYVYQFRHLTSEQMNPSEQQASDQYDKFLRYYIEGLTLAGSPYAFPTIGSLIAVHALTYASIRGFPKRNAGEDFYFLNKAKKVSTILLLQNSTLTLSGRVSHRVPFGTGKSVFEISQLIAQGKPYLVYDPIVFCILKSLLEALDLFAHSRDLDALTRTLITLGLESEVTFLRQALIQAVNTRPTFETLRKHLEDWFDAFRTLKFIHRLRDQSYPSIPLEEALLKFNELKTALRGTSFLEQPDRPLSRHARHYPLSHEVLGKPLGSFPLQE